MGVGADAVLAGHHVEEVGAGERRLGAEPLGADEPLPLLLGSAVLREELAQVLGGHSDAVVGDGGVADVLARALADAQLVCEGLLVEAALVGIAQDGLCTVVARYNDEAGACFRVENVQGTGARAAVPAGCVVGNGLEGLPFLTHECLRHLAGFSLIDGVGRGHCT